MNDKVVTVYTRTPLSNPQAVRYVTHRISNFGRQYTYY